MPRLPITAADFTLEHAARAVDARHAAPVLRAGCLEAWPAPAEWSHDRDYTITEAEAVAIERNRKVAWRRANRTRVHAHDERVAHYRQVFGG